MCSRFLVSTISGLGLFILSDANAGEPFRICAEPDNLPFAEGEKGLEIDVAKLLAQDLGRPFEVRWVAQRDYSFYRTTIAAGACDALMGVPPGFARLETTKPWYKTGFVFLSKRSFVGDIVRSFDDERLRGMKIGVPITSQGADTPPAIALAHRAMVDNIRPFSVYAPRRMVEAVARGEVDTAVMWGPFAGWFAVMQPEPMVLARAPARDGATPFAFEISIGVRKGDKELRDQLDTALEHRRKEIDVLLDRWRIPHGQDW
jgi:mxaJ protein